MLTGSIIDFYDDPTGQILKQKLNHEDIPDFVKEASFLLPETRGKLPDDVFALVAIDRGEKLRKYACTDKGNTALSVLYFLENRDKLPAEAQKVAAANLCEACGWYDMDPPDPLLKVAGWFDKAKSVASAVKSKTQDVGRAAQEAGGKVKAKVRSRAAALDNRVQSRINKEVEKRVVPTVNKNVKAELKAEGKSIGKKAVKGAAIGAGAVGAGTGAYLGGRAIMRRKRKTAAAERPGMAAQFFGTKKARDYDVEKAKGVKGYEYLTPEDSPKKKKASALQPYVDITGLEAPPQFEKRASVRMAGHMPIDSYGEVMDAQKWFNENPDTLHPEARRDFCIKLASRAVEIGQPVVDRIRKYAGAGFAPDGEVRVAVSTRMQFWPEDSPEHGVLNGLMDKYASVQPEVFCEALKQFDEANGLNHYWDAGIYDPWYSTFGFTKTAQWEFSTHGDKINEEQLKQVSNAAHPQISSYFGDEIANELRKSPVNIFSSLPLDSKRIIMRIVNDPQPSGLAINPS